MSECISVDYLLICSSDNVSGRRLLAVRPPLLTFRVTAEANSFHSRRLPLPGLTRGSDTLSKSRSALVLFPGRV